MSTEYDFTGKVVLITGSSSGIGAGIALLFSRSCAEVVVTGLDKEGVTDVAQQCLEVSPHKWKALEVVADLNDENECKRLIDSTIATFGKLDILVNCLGMGCQTNLDDPKFVDTFKAILYTNLVSVIRLTQLSAKHLEKTKGNIINISGVLSKQTSKDLSPSCVSKAGLDMFTKCMAVELGPKGIRVNSVNPGVIETKAYKAHGMNADQFFEDMAKKYPVGRVGQPKDIANVVLYLASEQASFVTGINLVADGGHLAANATICCTKYL